MSTPTIYKISDRAPEFPCWLYGTLNTLYPVPVPHWRHSEEASDSAKHFTASPFVATHWTHSNTMPTVTPEDAQPEAAPTPEVEKLPTFDECEEAIRNGTANQLHRFIVAWEPAGDEAAKFKSDLARALAEKDAEIARLIQVKESYQQREKDQAARAEKPEAELRAINQSLGYDDAWVNGKSLSVAVGILREQRDQLRVQLDAWHSLFGTTQLSHAIAERDQLRAEVERLTQDKAALKEYFDANPHALATQVKDLRAQLAAAQEDTKRLDWLAATGYKWEPFDRDELMCRVSPFVTWKDGVSLRAAIDAARAKEDRSHD